MTQDAQQFRRQISSREDRLLELYERVEQATATATATAERLRAAEAEQESSQTRLRETRQALQQQIGQAEQRRAQIQSEVDPASLRTYESLRRTRGGQAVARVTQRTCQGCRVSLPVSEEVRARSSPDLVFCQSCGRILYAGP